MGMVARNRNLEFAGEHFWRKLRDMIDDAQLNMRLHLSSIAGIQERKMKYLATVPTKEPEEKANGEQTKTH